MVAAAQQKRFEVLPLSMIDCEAQVRVVDEAGLAGLAKTLATTGLLQPILVRVAGERYVVVDGERRLLAAKRLGWDCIEAVVAVESLEDADRLVRQMVANCQREGLTPIETARGIEQLRTLTGCTSAEAATKLGFSSANVSKLLSLLTLPAEVQQKVHDRDLALTTAYEVAKTKDPERRAELIAEAVGGGLRREVAARRSRSGAKKRRGKAPGPASTLVIRRAVVDLEDGRAVAIVGRNPTAKGLLLALEQAAALLRTLDPTAEGAALLSALAEHSLRRRAGANGHHRSDAMVASLAEAR